MADKPLMPRIELQDGPASDVCRLRLRIEDDLFWFDGHFPDTPILPGVVQMNWARQLGFALWPECEWIRRASNLEVVKFQQVVRPGDSVELVLTLERDRQRLGFAYSAGEKHYSSGRLVVVA